jgi:hypothetical protein
MWIYDFISHDRWTVGTIELCCSNAPRSPLAPLGSDLRSSVEVPSLADLAFAFAEPGLSTSCGYPGCAPGPHHGVHPRQWRPGPVWWIDTGSQLPGFTRRARGQRWVRNRRDRFTAAWPQSFCQQHRRHTRRPCLRPLAGATGPHGCVLQWRKLVQCGELVVCSRLPAARRRRRFAGQRGRRNHRVESRRIRRRTRRRSERWPGRR